MAFHAEYVDVPDVASDAVPDQRWLTPVRSTELPAAYLPPSMPGPQPPWRKVAAWVLITMFVSATTGGICLTYGPAELFSKLGH